MKTSEILKSNLSSSAKLVCIYLNEESINGEIQASFAKIGKDLRISKGTIIKSLKELQEEGVVEAKKITDSNIGTYANKYILKGIK